MRVLLFLLMLGVVCLVPLLPSLATTPDTLVLTAANTVSLNVPIMSDSASAVQKELMAKSAKLNKNDRIILVLNSPGGSIDAGLKIIETAKGLPQKVDTLSIFSASMSFILSQYLATRYALDSSTLMSHRAYVQGIEGNMPGSFLNRTLSIQSNLADISNTVAKRVGMTLPAYEALIADELWMNGNQAVKLKMADKVIKVRCDNTLQGYGPTQTVQVFIFKAVFRFHKCPLITEPEIVEGNFDFANTLFNDKPLFIRQYINTGLLNKAGQ